MKNKNMFCQIPVIFSLEHSQEKIDSSCCFIENLVPRLDSNLLDFTNKQKIDLNKKRFKMISRKKVINLFIRYYLNEDRNNVRSLLNSCEFSQDFYEELSALESKNKIDPKILIKKEKDGSIDALQKRQKYVMRERIEAINERLKLGGYSLLTEKEVHQIYKNWPSIYQIIGELTEEQGSDSSSDASTDSIVIS